MMDDKKPFREELRYPVLCHYRIIAKNVPQIDFVIETVLAGLGVREKLVREKESGKGTYQSFSVDIMVDSKTMMEKIDAELRSIEGVKMVL